MLAFKSVPPAGQSPADRLSGRHRRCTFQAHGHSGDQLVLEADVDRIVRNIGKFRCRALVDGQLAAEALLMAALRVA